MKSLVKIAMALTVVMFIGGCSKGSDAATPTSQAKSSGLSLAGKTIYISSASAGYTAKSRVAENIKNECKLGTQLITFIQAAAEKQGMTVKVGESTPAGGIELKVEITDAVSRGNAFTGHRKFASIAGSLTQNGSSIGSFEAARRTGGGMFGGFKGSCGVLARSVNALANDTVRWMKTPTPNAALGDTRLIPRY
jgi:hypothetical protein